MAFLRICNVNNFSRKNMVFLCVCTIIHFCFISFRRVLLYDRICFLKFWLLELLIKYFNYIGNFRLEGFSMFPCESIYDFFYLEVFQLWSLTNFKWQESFIKFKPHQCCSITKSWDVLLSFVVICLPGTFILFAQFLAYLSAFKHHLQSALFRCFLKCVHVLISFFLVIFFSLWRRFSLSVRSSSSFFCCFLQSLTEMQNCKTFFQSSCAFQVLMHHSSSSSTSSSSSIHNILYAW